MDVQAQVNKRMDDYIKSEKFEEKMNSIVEKTVNDAVESLFSYGELRNTIREMFKEKLAIDVQRIDWPHVNQIVTDIVKQKTAAAFAEPLRTKLAAELDDMFAPAPAEITVQGIIDLLREELRDDGCGCADPEESMAVDISACSYGYTLKIWEGERYGKTYLSSDRRENSPKVHIYVHKDDGHIGVIHGLDVFKGFATGVYGFDAKIFMMYCAGTKITDIGTVNADHLETRINDHIDY